MCASVFMQITVTILLSLLVFQHAHASAEKKDERLKRSNVIQDVLGNGHPEEYYELATGKLRRPPYFHHNNKRFSQFDSTFEREDRDYKPLMFGKRDPKRAPDYEPMMFG